MMIHARTMFLALAVVASPISAQIIDMQLFSTIDHCKTTLTTSELGRKDSVMKKGEYLNLVNKYLSEIYSNSILTHPPFPQLPAKMGIIFDQELAQGGEIDIFGARPLQDLSEEQAEHLLHVCTRTVEGLGEYMSVIDSGFSPATLQQEPEEEEGNPPEGAGNGEEGGGPPEGAGNGEEGGGRPEGAGNGEEGGPPEGAGNGEGGGPPEGAGEDFGGPTTQQANATGGPFSQNIEDVDSGEGNGPTEGAGNGEPSFGQGNSSLSDFMPPQNTTGRPEQNNATGGSELPVPDFSGDLEDSMLGENETDASMFGQSNTSDTSEGDVIPGQNTTESVPIPSQNITGGPDQNMADNLEDPMPDQNATEAPIPGQNNTTSGQNNTNELLGPSAGQNNTDESLEPIPGQNNTDESPGLLQNITDEIFPGQNSTIDPSLGLNNTDEQNDTGFDDIEDVDELEPNTTESNATAAATGESVSKTVTATSGFIVKTDEATLSDSDLETLTMAFSDFISALTAGSRRLVLRGQRRRLYSVDEDSVNIFGVEDAACPEPSRSRMLQELNISATNTTADPPPNTLPENSNVPVGNVTDEPNTTASPLDEEFADENIDESLTPNTTASPLDNEFADVDLDESLTDSNATTAPVSASNDTTPETTESDTTTLPVSGSNSTPSSDAVCQKISVSYDVVLEDGEDPETVLEEIMAAAREGIDDGTLQDSIVNVDPDSPVIIEESTVPPPAPTEPPLATFAPSGLNNTTAAPTENAEKENKDDEKSSSMMPIIIGVVVGMLVLCGCAGGGYWFTQQKKVSEDTAGDEKPFDDEDEDLEKGGEATDGENDGEPNKNDETFEHSDENDGEEGFVHATEPAFDNKDEPSFEAKFGDDQEAPSVEEPVLVAEELFEDEPEAAAKDSEFDGDDLDNEAAAEGEENQEESDDEKDISDDEKDDEKDGSDEEGEKDESQDGEPEKEAADAADPPQEMSHPDPDGEAPEVKEPEGEETAEGNFDTEDDENEEGWDTEEGDDHSSVNDDGDIDDAGEPSDADEDADDNDDDARSEPSEVDSDGVDWDAEEEGGEDNGDEGSDFGDDNDAGDSDFNEDGNDADEAFDESEPDDASFDDSEQDLQ